MALAGPSLGSSAQSSWPGWCINILVHWPEIKSSWCITAFLTGATEARTSSWADLPLPRGPGHRIWWGRFPSWCLPQWHTITGPSRSWKCYPTAFSAFLLRGVKRSFSCVPSLSDDPNARIHKVPAVSWKPEWCKQTNSPQLKEPLWNNMENVALWVFELGLLAQVCWSCFVTLKALGADF